MGYQIADVLGGQMVALHHLLRYVGHVRYGCLENGWPVLGDRVPVVAHGFFGSGIARAACFHIEVLFARTVRMEDRIDDAVTLFVGFQQYGRCAVAENRTSVAVLVIDDRGHLVGADDDYFFGIARFDELGPCRQGEQEAAACSGNVVGESVFTTGLVGDQIARRGEKHIRGNRGADHDVDLQRINPGFFQQVFDGACAHIRCTQPLSLEDMAGFDADTCHDPLVGSVHHSA